MMQTAKARAWVSGVLVFTSGAFTMACSARVPSSPEGVSPLEAPILPAPEAGSYTRSEASPRDPLVARVVEGAGWAWEETLSGGAAGIALGTQTADIHGARWSSIVAGYPYPVTNLVQGETDRGAWPEGLDAAIEGLLQPGDDLGLVRARRGERDVWVGLIGRPSLAMMSFAKELPPGGSLDLRTRDGHTPLYILVSPTGRVQQGQLPAQPTLSETGEWWIEVRSSSGEKELSLPVYVGQKTPSEPLLELPGRAVSSVEEAVQESALLLEEVRRQFELAALVEDGILTTLALDPLERHQKGSWEMQSGIDRLAAAGFIGEETAQLACQAVTVAQCVSDLMEQPLSRRSLIRSDVGVYGVAASVESDGVSLIINLASQ
jgi:hypothetical protein